MGNRLQCEQIGGALGQVGTGQSAPARDEHPALPRSLECLPHELGRLLGVAVRHAAKANIHRWWTGLEKVNQRGGRLPIRRMIEKPVAGDVDMLSPIGRLGDDDGAETVQHGQGLAV